MMDFTNLLVPNGEYAKRSFSDTVDGTETYTFPVTQGYIKITNPLNGYIVVNVGHFTNKIIGRYETWEGYTEFKSFDVTTTEEATITYETREYVDRFTTQDQVVMMNVLQIASKGDMVLTGTDLGTSAATINAGITADGYYDVDFTFVVEDTSAAQHTWYNGELDAEVVVTSDDGVAEVLSCSIVEGDGTATVRYTGEYVAGDTVVMTVTGGTLLGYTVADATITDTVIA